MAFSGMGSNGGGRGGRRRWGGGSLSEMNVVPLVDVVLVLLIIFMITASAMEFGLEVEVPVVKQTRTTTEEPPVATIDKQATLYLNDKPVNINDLAAEVRKQFPDQDTVFVRADQTTNWGLVASVFSELGAAGFKTSAVTKAEDIRGKKR